MERGIVKKFNASKGYGFIARESGADMFFHFTGLVMDGYKTIDDGVEVEFEIVPGRKEGTLQATNIVPVTTTTTTEA